MEVELFYSPKNSDMQSEDVNVLLIGPWPFHNENKGSIDKDESKCSERLETDFNESYCVELNKEVESHMI